MIGFREWYRRTDGPGITAKCTHLENPTIDDVIAVNLKRMYVEQVWLGPHCFFLCDKCVDELRAMMDIAAACIQHARDG
jgi:hypothetical protein